MNGNTATASRTRAHVDCMPEAPPEWDRVPLSTVVEVNRKYDLEVGRRYPFVPMASVAEQFRGVTEYLERTPEETGLSRFTKNDTIFAKITPCAEHGKIAFIDELPDEHGVGSTEFIVLSPRPGFDPRFVFNLVSCPAVHNRAVARMEGSTGRLRVNESEFRKWLWVAVPERKEQEAIAGCLKTADEYLNSLESQLEAARLHHRSLIERLVCFGIGEPSAIRTIERFRHPFRFNDNWDIKFLKELKPQIEYGTNAPSNDHNEGVRVIAIPQVLSSRFASTELPYCIVSADEESSLSLEPCDVLLVRTNGNPNYIGRSTVIPHNLLTETTVFASYLIRVRTDQNVVRGPFLNYVLHSDVGRRQTTAMANTSAGNFNLGARSLSQLLIPVPPPEVQDDIVAVIDASDDLILELECELNAANELKKSLLENLLTGQVRLKR